MQSEPKIARIRKSVIDTYKNEIVYKVTNTYVQQCLNDIHKILNALQYSDEDIKNILTNPVINESGQVPANTYLDVINGGNIRERMTMIMNFGKRGCNVIWKIVEMYINAKKEYAEFAILIHEENLKKRIQKITKLLGLWNKNETKTYESLATFIDNQSRCTNDNICLNPFVIDPKKSPCMMASLSKSSPVTATRMKFPFGNVRSESKVTEKNVRRIKFKNVLPELSEREKTLLKIVEENDDKVISWNSGYMGFNPNPDNFYVKQAIYYNHDIIAGPSGNTDLQMDIFSLLKIFDVNISVVACVIWMCNTPDHSLHDIFLAAVGYGFEYNPFIKGEPEPYEYTHYRYVLDTIRDKHAKAKKHVNVSVKCNATLTSVPSANKCRLGFNKDKTPNFAACNTILTNIRHYNKLGYNKKFINQKHYILGRDALLQHSGFKDISKICFNIETLILPWRDTTYTDPPINGFRYWNPRVNNDLIWCAFNNLNESPIRLLIHKYDVEYITNSKRIDELEALRDQNVDVYGNKIIYNKVSIFLPNNPAQSVVENCQLFFHYSTESINLQILIERNPTDKDNVYTAFLVPYIKTIHFPEDTFVNCTDRFKELLIKRLETKYMLNIYGTHSYDGLETHERVLNEKMKNVKFDEYGVVIEKPDENPVGVSGGVKHAFKPTDKRVTIGKRKAIIYKKEKDRKDYVLINKEYKTLKEVRKAISQARKKK